MLVLTRRQGESIIIGDGIKLTVVNVGPGRVKIGIVAPPNVRIDREEIHARIQQEQSTDVLAAVSADVLNSQSDANTIVSAGPDTGILHNRIADKISAEDTPAPAQVAAATPSTNSISKYRAPRKTK